MNKIFLRRCLTIFIATVAALGAYALFLFLSAQQESTDVLQIKETTEDQNVVSIGGDFILTDIRGHQKDTRKLRGRFLLVYFGYSYCPDICPAALDHITQALHQLGQQGKKIQPIFITVDPTRDTAIQLKDYMQNFHPTFLALRGTEEELKDVTKKFKVFARKVKEDGTPLKAGENIGEDYLIDHSSIIYLISPKGRFVAHFNHLTPPDILAEKLGLHLKNTKRGL